MQSVVICPSTGEFLLVPLQSTLYLAPYVYVTWAITSVKVMLSSACSLIPFCGVMNTCGETVVCVVHVVACVWGYRFFPILDMLFVCSARPPMSQFWFLS
jgi:hypothetical protein